ncbi:uncharacterized protein LOC119309874 [Triticum dicoccoides]|uniref:uncharacterized protein LOC119309874 n=1 Tax=Triticum dicoccoides TaxID=85692 RepID=UPI001891E6B7|nr:uncharacterized protein LOC119309874 [Triticum dicoccoides]
MSFRRAVGFLLTRRSSPRVIPRTGPGRSLKELPIGRGAAGVAAAAFAGAGAWAVQYFRTGPDDVESAAPKKEQDTKASFENWMKEEDMTARFENWMKEYNKTYRDEEEKAMRFQVFKDTVKSIESLPPSTHKKFLPPNGFADLTSKELPCIQPCIDDDLDDPDSEEYRQNKFLAENENGEAVIW